MGRGCSVCEAVLHVGSDHRLLVRIILVSGLEIAKPERDNSVRATISDDTAAL